jgi:cyclopropane fatty-acyl-phospholipid synthase-like methyltransferase
MIIITDYGVIISGITISWEEYEKVLLSVSNQDVAEKFKNNLKDITSFARIRFDQTEDIEYLNEIASVLKIKQGLLVKPLKVKIRKKINQLFNRQNDLKIIKI